MNPGSSMIWLYLLQRDGMRQYGGNWAFTPRGLLTQQLWFQAMCAAQQHTHTHTPRLHGLQVRDERVSEQRLEAAPVQACHVRQHLVLGGGG
jgi:hypothetical protein